MLPVIGWLAWYDDGSRYSSETHGWTDLPAAGVQALCWLHEPPYSDWLYGEDEYRVEPGGAAKLGTWLTGFDALLADAYAHVRSLGYEG